jgi:hypothetical protein
MDVAITWHSEKEGAERPAEAVNSLALPAQDPDVRRERHPRHVAMGPQAGSHLQKRCVAASLVR